MPQCSNTFICKRKKRHGKNEEDPTLRFIWRRLLQKALAELLQSRFLSDLSVAAAAAASKLQSEVAQNSCLRQNVVDI